MASSNLKLIGPEDSDCIGDVRALLGYAFHKVAIGLTYTAATGLIVLDVTDVRAFDDGDGETGTQAGFTHNLRLGRETTCYAGGFIAKCDARVTKVTIRPFGLPVTSSIAATLTYSSILQDAETHQEQILDLITNGVYVSAKWTGETCSCIFPPLPLWGGAGQIDDQQSKFAMSLKGEGPGAPNNLWEMRTSLRAPGYSKSNASNLYLHFESAAFSAGTHQYDVGDNALGTADLNIFQVFLVTMDYEPADLSVQG